MAAVGPVSVLLQHALQQMEDLLGECGVRACLLLSIFHQHHTHAFHKRYLQPRYCLFEMLESAGAESTGLAGTGRAKGFLFL